MWTFFFTQHKMQLVKTMKIIHWFVISLKYEGGKFLDLAPGMSRGPLLTSNEAVLDHNTMMASDGGRQSSCFHFYFEKAKSIAYF